MQLDTSDLKSTNAQATAMVAARVPRELWVALRKLAKERGVRPSSIIRKALAVALGYKGAVD